MSYEQTEWKSGDVVTSAKLNKLEQGVANAGSATIVTLTFNRNPNDPSQWTATGNITFEELKPIAENGGVIILRGDFSGNGGSASMSAYGYVVSADIVTLRISGGFDTIVFSAMPGEQLSGSTV